MPLTSSSPLPADPDRAAGPQLWRVTVLLTAAIFGLLLLANHQYLFDTKLYENTDQASDSLLVREAKHTVLLHGHYSQWRFYHPGPALLDTLAAGEALFHDALHLVPTPYNGQLIMLCLAMSLFFSLALAVFANRLGRERGAYLFFLPQALLFGVLHYGAVGGQVFLDAWPAYPLVIVLLCFMVAAAATASGDGWKLPVLVTAGGWLVHNHVAQPLFVVPLFLLAYAGLLATCRWQGAGEAQGGVLAAGWRAFPRAHGIAVGLLALFILPLAVDALHGSHSNLARILEYLRSPHESGKRFMRSLCYFLTFGGYSPYPPDGHEPIGGKVTGALPYFGHFTGAGMLSFVGSHGLAFGFWIVALVGAPPLFHAADRRLGYPGRSYFVWWFYAILATTFGLTLVWGMRQTGPMFYYNAYFNYSIYYGVALGLAAAVAVALMAWTGSPAMRRLRPAISVILWVGAATAAVIQGQRFRVSAFAAPKDAAAAATVRRAAASLPPGAVCFVDCRPWENWRSAIAVVLELERLGCKARVNDNWAIIFGNPQTIQHEHIGATTPLARWMIVSQGGDPGSAANQRPLLFGTALEIKPLPSVDPNGQHIGFSRGGNYDEFAYYGWSQPDGDWTWSDQRSALMAFHPLPLPSNATGVDLVISAWTSPPPGKTDLQRMAVQFNDTMLSTFRLPLYNPTVQPLRVRVDAALWRTAVAMGEARLQFIFPDAKSPAELGLGADHRLLGGGFRAVDFLPALTFGLPEAATRASAIAPVGSIPES